jgi:uncharacterized membrane protein YeaQ/YmgE (transglycosylase-associated protein family)
VKRDHAHRENNHELNERKPDRHHIGRYCFWLAGWLAGKIVDGGGFGLIGDLVVGIIGAFIGDWLLPRLNIHLGVGIVSLIINATLGAIVLLVLLRVVTGRGSRWGGRWGRS